MGYFRWGGWRRDARYILLNSRAALHLSPPCHLTWQTISNVLPPGPANYRSFTAESSCGIGFIEDLILCHYNDSKEIHLIKVGRIVRGEDIHSAL